MRLVGNEPEMDVASDLMFGGAGVAVNLSQAGRAYDRSVKGAEALLNAIAGKMHEFNLPGFKREPDTGPSN